LDLLYVIFGSSKKETKEETIMKTIAVQNKRKTVRPAYPNAADRRYYLGKLLDGVLALATVVGGITALVFLLLL
jgi:hypothetical protein